MGALPFNIIGIDVNKLVMKYTFWYLVLYSNNVVPIIQHGYNARAEEIKLHTKSYM